MQDNHPRSFHLHNWITQK